MDSEEETYLCHQCGKMFYKLSTLESHAKWKHSEKTHVYMCDQCGRTFQKKYNLIKHLESGIHEVSETVKCAVCEFRAQNRKIMGEHYQNFHEVTLKESSAYFKTAEEFYSWKNEFELKTKSRFVKMSSSRKRKNGFTRSTYFCHRDGNFIPKGKNLRHLKVKGSNKINAHCPAKMDVDIGERLVIVSYIDTHLGHEMDITRMNLDPLDKALIAEKLAQKVPFEKILDEINKSAEDSELKRVNFLTRKDLWNIVDTFKINPESIVYSKTRRRRKQKLERPKKEHSKKNAYVKVFDPNSKKRISKIQEAFNVKERMDCYGVEALAVKHEDEENLIICPIMIKNENDEYIQEYAVISDENDLDTGTCYVINSDGELESLSGHRVIYTEDGNVEIAEDLLDDEEDRLDENEELGVPQTVQDDLCEISVLSEEVEEETCENSSIDQTVYFEEDSQTEISGPQEEMCLTTTLEDESNINLSSTTNNITEETIVKMAVEETPQYQVNLCQKEKQESKNVFYTENCSNLVADDQHVLPTVDEIAMEDHPEYEVTIENYEGEEEVNEYVIISTDEHLDQCTVITAENDTVHEFVNCPIKPEIEIKVKEEIPEESVIKEEVVDSYVYGAEECIAVFEPEKPKWGKKRQEVLNKLLNVHSMIDNEKQLQVFSKNITSLENVLKSLSKNNQVPHSSGSEPHNKKSSEIQHNIHR